MKICTKCKTDKELSEFRKRSRNPDLLESHCKECMKAAGRKHYQENKEWYKQQHAKVYQNNKEKVNQKSKERYLRKVFNLTLEEYQKIVDENKNCPLCYSLFTETNKPCLDHCHTTGQLRKPLCRQCNLVLGLVKDDTQLLERAIDYLKGFNDS